jgi:hypothetical protein
VYVLCIGNNILKQPPRGYKVSMLKRRNRWHTTKNIRCICKHILNFGGP